MIEDLLRKDFLQERLLAIIGPAERWQALFKGDGPNQPVADMLKEFRLFALHYFAYLAQGASGSGGAQDLRTAFDVIHREWETISRVCEQRQVEDYREFLGGAEGADEQARQYYERFYGLKAAGTPITYFGKIWGITRSPFMSYPLISLPLYVFNNPKQWYQGLPHEIGHYIYWNSARTLEYRKVQLRLRDVVLKALDVSTEEYGDFQRKARLVDVWVSWMEETFADICGVLLAGPDFVESALQRNVAEALLTLDDLEHPVPYLRPLIGIEALQWVSGQLADRPEQQVLLASRIAELMRQWKASIGEQTLRRGQAVKHERSGLEMSEIERSVAPVVHTILGGSSKRAPKSWVGKDGAPQSLGRLIRYEDWLPQLADVAGSEARKMRQEERVRSFAAANLPILSVDRLYRQGWDRERSGAFDALVDYLAKEIRKEKPLTEEEIKAEIRKVLLNLGLEVSRRDVTCFQKWVKWVEAGGMTWLVEC